MKRIVSISSFAFLLAVVVYYAGLGVRLFLCQNVSSEVQSLVKMTIEDLSDLGFLCVGARVLLLLVRQVKMSTGHIGLLLLLSGVWAVVIRLLAPQITPVIELWINKVTPKDWLMGLHVFVVLPCLFAFLFALKDLFIRFVRGGVSSDHASLEENKVS